MPGQDVSTLKDDEIFYFCCAGLGSYMDADTLDLIGEREHEGCRLRSPDSDVNYYNDVMASELDANKVSMTCIGRSPARRAMWRSSGVAGATAPSGNPGDGQGHPLVLLTDFQVVENADGRREPKHP